MGTMTKDLHRILAIGLLGCFGAIGFAGCTASLPEVHGQRNVTALDYLKNCQYGVAMHEVDEAIQSLDWQTRATAVTIKAAIYLDQGNTRDAQALYQRIVNESEEIATVSAAEKEVDRIVKDVRKVRKSETGSADCP